MSITVYPGHPYPLGATWDGNGVNFAIYADNATKVELCLFNNKSSKKSRQKLSLQSEPIKYGMHTCQP